MRRSGPPPRSDAELYTRAFAFFKLLNGLFVRNLAMQDRRELPVSPDINPERTTTIQRS